jgi:hypothetical protein
MELRIFRCRREVLCWNGVHEMQTVDVLQFRVKQDTGGCDVALTDPWGPWQDVPIVREKRDAGEQERS